MVRLHQWLCLFALLLLAVTGCNAPEQHTTPNILYIFPDQYRQYSLGFWSQGDHARHIQGRPDPVSTPSLDQLAGEGVVFSRAVSNFPLCSPYRGMLLSGMYPEHNGLTYNCRREREVQLRPDAECLTDVFSAAGYHVAYFGKCHWVRTEPLFDTAGTYVGSTDPPGGHYINAYDTYVPPGPHRHGIDYFYQTLKDDHFHPLVYSNDPLANQGRQDGEQHRPTIFSSELEAQTIMDYLSNTHDQRDTDKPFMIIWSLNPPHNPWTPSSTHMDFFGQYTDAGEVRLDRLLTHENADPAAGKHAPYYFANVSAVDHFIGKVLDHLDELGLSENTIVVFSSDHGEMLGSHGRQGKTVPETEAFNIPFILKWPGRLAHRIDDMILSVPDIMPTLMGLAGLEEAIPASVQGHNYADVLLDPRSDRPASTRSALYWNRNARGVYTGKYTFVVTQQDGRMQEAYCYDNEADPAQLNKISHPDLDPAVSVMLKAELRHLLEATNDSWSREGICHDFLND